MSKQGRNEEDLEIREEEEEVLKLEEEVERMAEKVVEYRTTLPDQLTSSLTSLLASQRPILTDPEASTIPGSNAEAAVSQGEGRPGESGSMTLLTIEDEEESKKIQLLKQKIVSNASTMHIALQRMKEYMARIDKLESSWSGVIPPAFKRKRTS